MTQKFKVGDRIVRTSEFAGLLQYRELEAPPGSTGYVVSQFTVGNHLYYVKWDEGVTAYNGEEPVTTMHPSEIKLADELVYHAASCPCAPSKPVACRAPWWAVWNPCSRFGWIVYMVLGAMVPTILQNI